MLNNVQLQIKTYKYSDAVELSPRELTLKVFENFFHSWNSKRKDLHTILYNDNWINNPTPLELIKNMSEDEFNNFWEKYSELITDHFNDLKVYTSKAASFGGNIDQRFHELKKNPVAYFSMEFGIVDWLYTYSGGLGMLAGDVLKQASDYDIPLYGVSIYYHHGYFLQRIDEWGNQVDDYPYRDTEDYPFELAKNSDGEIAEVEINIVDHPVFVRAWIAKVGRRDLILLDTNFEKNTLWEDRMISAHLYGGDEDTRIRQEILLGIGGYKMLKEMGVEPSIYHMNEGHSAFVSIAMAESYMISEKIDFEHALEKVKNHLIFTNHTLKTAGNDIFSQSLVEKYLSKYAADMNVDFSQIYKLGTEEPVTHGKFSMTMAGFNNAKIINGVSKLHSKAAKSIWPNHELLPITNGAHMPGWVGRHIAQLLENFVHKNWYDPYVEIDTDDIDEIPANFLWDAHQKEKKELISMINKHLGKKLKEDVLTLSWFRRFAAYKRPDIIISDIEKLISTVNNKNMPVQIIMGGKAHPRDTQGREIFRQINEVFRRNELSESVVFIPEYNWAFARSAVSGSDVWVNTPTRFEEASGTSGMKAAVNGVLQYTTLDGWTDEVNWEGKGFVLSDHNAEIFYSIITDEIAPMYYSRNYIDIPQQWTVFMKNTIKAVLENYSTKRMLEDYINNLYLPLIRDQNSRF